MGPTTTAQFGALLLRANYSETDQVEFTNWIRQYGRTVPKINGRLPVTPESIEDFLRPLREREITATQQLQALRAVIAYRQLVLGRKSPMLPKVASRLSRYAAQEQNARRALRANHSESLEPMQAVA